MILWCCSMLERDLVPVLNQSSALTVDRKTVVWTKKSNLPGSILWHLGYGQPMMKSYSSYPAKEGDHIQSYGIYLWAVLFPCGAGESAKFVPRICLITELQRELKSTVWVCFLVLFNLLMKKRSKKSVWLLTSSWVFWGSPLQLMHLMCLETHFVLSLLKTVTVLH